MKTKNQLGMSALISHPDKKTIEQQLQIFADVGFDSFFLSCGVTNQYEKIPYWSACAKSLGISFEAVHAPSDFVNSVWVYFFLNSIAKWLVFTKPEWIITSEILFDVVTSGKSDLLKDIDKDIDLYNDDWIQ